MRTTYGPLWFPNFWLTFLLVGAPCPVENMKNPFLLGGRMNSQSTETGGLIETMGGHLSRSAVRKANLDSRNRGFNSSPFVVTLNDHRNIVDEKTHQSNTLITM